MAGRPPHIAGLNLELGPNHFQSLEEDDVIYETWKFPFHLEVNERKVGGKTFFYSRVFLLRALTFEVPSRQGSSTEREAILREVEEATTNYLNEASQGLLYWVQRSSGNI